MQAEIIAIGSELTTGAKLDTNSQWLSVELAAVGIPVAGHSTVADDLDDMVGILHRAVDRSDVVLLTGGLGPTLDDITRHALAKLVGRELVVDEPSLEFIKSLFARRNRRMAERNAVQAMFPEGSQPISNPRGTAPGIWMEVPRPDQPSPCHLAAMPGVPSEMKRMFQNEVLPRLSGKGMVIRRARVNCFGVGESDAEAKLGELTARRREPEVGITVHEATITLRITAHGRSEQECQASIAETKALIRKRMGSLVFGEDDEELEHVVVRMLNQRKLTLATAESGTGGLLAHRLTEVDGFESCYLGGLIVPTDHAKHELLDVDNSLLANAGPVSAEVAQEMARGCRRQFGTDFAVAVTECPRFDPDDTQADAPSAFVSLAGNDLLEVNEHTLIGDPVLVKSRAAKIALNLLRLHLIRRHGLGETP